MTELVQDTAWQADALRLRETTEMGTSDIGEAVGKHPATIRKLFARNPPADRVLSSEEAAAAFSDVPPEDDPEYEAPHQDDFQPGLEEPRDPLEDFRAEAGEAVGPMPPEQPRREMDEGEEVEAPKLQGTRQMAIDFGPEADIPVGGTLVIKSDKLASGFFGLGDVIHGSFTARVVDVGGKERLQRASEEFRAQPQAHVALITEIEVVASSA